MEMTSHLVKNNWVNEDSSTSPSYFSYEEESKEDVNREIASDFNNDNETVFFVGINDFNKSNQLNSFYNFVTKRKHYLDSLDGIENWISGNALTPSRDVIDTSKHLLDTFKNWVSAQNKIPLPKIIMGPIPCGGITVELRPNSRNGMFINILNDESIEIEVMMDDKFYSIDKVSTKANPFILEAYETIVNE